MADWRFELVPAPERGCKTQGYVDWGDPVLSGWKWPYIAVHGREPGAAVLVTAGIHGSEYASIDAAVQLAATLDPAGVRGQILCLPLMNPPAFQERTAYVSPVDNLNLNRVFPGSPRGSFTERLAWSLVQRAMRHADACLDLHGGDLPEALAPFTLHYETGESATDARSRKMASAFGSSSLLVQQLSAGPITGLAAAAAASLGIPAIIAEDGDAGLCAPAAAARLLAGTQNVLRTLDVLDGAVQEHPPPRCFDEFVWIRSRAGGFFKQSVQVGDDVEAGTIIGTIYDFFGKVIETVTASASGKVLFLVISPAMTRDGLVCGIGRREAADAAEHASLRDTPR